MLRQTIILIVLLTFLSSVALAITPPPQTGTLPAGIVSQRDQELGALIQAEMLKNRQWLDEFGVNTRDEIQAQEKAALDNINRTMVKFKFTLFFTMLSSILVALEIHDLLRRRRDKRTDTLMNADRAQAMKDRMMASPEPPPLPSLPLPIRMV